MNTIEDIKKQLISIHDCTIISAIDEYENYINFIDAEPLCFKLLEDIKKLVENISINEG